MGERQRVVRRLIVTQVRVDSHLNHVEGMEMVGFWVFM